MTNSQKDLVNTVLMLPEERQDTVRQFIGFLNKNEEIIQIAMEWIIENLPDRYCAGEPHFDVQLLNWYVPINLSYPNGKGIKVGELIIDFRTQKIIAHSRVKEIRSKGNQFARELIHAKWKQMRRLTVLSQF